ncbi:unnamed protein product [Hydatigera taeniaeformis]|uniref:Uncharacterized protein n=1 Tax=Hydatigena taeniaeformis TaxID=6205 RepID=A0A0R3WTI9_HYDTA|nr:unnamed protein product [Hydatigera taeniaeformis]
MEEGCPLVDHLASSLGSLLDEVFQSAFELTYNTLNEHSDVNTSSLRHTLWFFVQSVFGVCHEDLRYERVHKLLSVEQRCFLKICATRPFDLIAYHPTACRELFTALSPPEVVTGCLGIGEKAICGGALENCWVRVSLFRALLVADGLRAVDYPLICNVLDVIVDGYSWQGSWDIKGRWRVLHRRRVGI